MHLHLTTLLFIIFEHINRVFTQGIPVSPCPKLFQYRFNGTEWFGILSVRNPDFGEALHLRVTLSLRGKPTTNYLGEIELLTRGQYYSDAPVLYKIKFPKNHFPPKVLQIMVNNNVLCLGGADHSIFVTQIILEHTRKFTFMSDDASAAMPLTPDFSHFPPPASGPPMAVAAPDDDDPIDLKHSDSLLPPPHSPTAGHAGFGAKHLPLSNLEQKQNPLRTGYNEICGRIDDRIRFQVLRALKEGSRGQQEPPHHPFVRALLQRSINGPGSSHRTTRTLNRPVTANGASLTPQLPAVVSSDEQHEDFTPVEDEDESSDTQSELPSITRGAWPWLTAIYVNNLTSLAYQCGGTLVSTRVVISSAHCFHMFQQRYTANEVLVFLGRHNLKNWNEEGSLAAPVDDIFTHPDYDSHLNSYDADIAVVVLKHQVRFNSFVRPACLWTGSTKSQYVEGELGIVVGWGLGNTIARRKPTQFNSPLTTAVPRVINAPIVPNGVCFKANKQFHSLSSNRTLCAGNTKTHITDDADDESDGGDEWDKKKKQLSKLKMAGARGPCTGDSGAGLMLYRNKRWVLRGTVSASLPVPETVDFCNVHSYVVYADVAKFLDWIYAFI